MLIIKKLKKESKVCQLILIFLSKYNFDSSAFNIALSNNDAYVTADDKCLIVLNY
jgi:hypothetical protein